MKRKRVRLIIQMFLVCCLVLASNWAIDRYRLGSLASGYWIFYRIQAESSDQRRAALIEMAGDGDAAFWLPRLKRLRFSPEETYSQEALKTALAEMQMLD